MAQDITLLGASYSDVPAVELPKTGGGTASFTDVTGTTAAAGDVAQGKLFYTAAGVLTEGTASGGGGIIPVINLTTAGVNSYTSNKTNQEIFEMCNTYGTGTVYMDHYGDVYRCASASFSSGAYRLEFTRTFNNNGVVVFRSIRNSYTGKNNTSFEGTSFNLAVQA